MEAKSSSDIAFTPSVKAIQARRGSREAYARMDYAHRRRVKIWGSARIVEADPDLISRLMPKGYPARAERAVLFEVKAWDVNCPRHIPQKLDAGEVAEVLAKLQNLIAALEAENDKLRAAMSTF